MTKTFFGRWNNLCFYFSKDISGRSFQESFLNNNQNDVITIMLYANYVMSKSLLLNGQRIVMLMIHYNLAYENLMYMEGISHIVIVLIPNFFALCTPDTKFLENVAKLFIGRKYPEIFDKKQSTFMDSFGLYLQTFISDGYKSFA